MLAGALWVAVAGLHAVALWSAAEATHRVASAEHPIATRSRAPAMQVVANPLLVAVPVPVPLPVPTRTMAQTSIAPHSPAQPRHPPEAHVPAAALQTDPAPAFLPPPAPSPSPPAAADPMPADAVPARLPSTTAEAVPRYPTQLPPPLHWRFQMRRGGRDGTADLRWSPTADSYRIDLLGWTSTGAFDIDGIAPERHTESRRGREWRAVNFQREQGRITFSGSQGDAPLGPGAQDRVSWMLQLAGVLAANSGLREPGSEVSLVVAGIRGSAGVWRFTNLRAEDLDLPAGRVAAALHLRRESEGPYDLQVDVWLDPARHFGPVRLLMQRPGVATDAPGQVELWLASDAP